MSVILAVILIFALVGFLPIWPHSAGYGYGPSGVLTLLVVVLIVLMLFGRI